MSVEYERRFLVPDASDVVHGPGSVIVQGYLHIKNGWCVRIRRRYAPRPAGGYAEATATAAIKGPREGQRRAEYEMTIGRAAAQALLKHTPWKIFKTRHQVVDGGYTFDVDVFHFRNEGLVIAECESTSRLDGFAPPRWCGREVTDDRRFDNEVLALRPLRDS